MPLYNWSITYSGEGVDAANEEVLKKTLLNQTAISGNVAGSVKKITVECEPQSGIIAVPSIESRTH